MPPIPEHMRHLLSQLSQLSRRLKSDRDKTEHARPALTEWVVWNLIKDVAYAIEAEAKYPSPRELRERLAEMEETARLLTGLLAREPLTRDLTDPYIVALLSNEGLPRKNLMILARDVRSVADGAKRLRDRIREVREQNPPKRGARKMYPAGATGPSALQYCALSGSMIYERIKGKWPAKGNPDVWTLCEAVWVAAGGTPHKPHSGASEREGVFKTWREHVKAAKEYQPPHDAGERVDSILRGRPVRKHRPPWFTDPWRWSGYDHPSWREFVATQTGAAKSRETALNQGSQN
jgi:hypothetical protein